MMMSRYIVFVVVISLGLCHLISSASEADHDEHLKKKHGSEVVVVGKVYCDTCFQQTSDTTANFISGASVAVECENKGNPARKRARTNRRGEFRVRLPLTLIQSCSVKLIHTTHPYCAIATSASSSNVRLRSGRRRHGTPVFSAGLFTFRPLAQPGLCNQKPAVAGSLSAFPPPLEDPAEPGELPPLPHLPIPDIPLPELPLPLLPHLPRLPNLPPLITARRTTEIHRDDIGARQFFFPPNPLQPPLIPNPLQPPPPLIPNPFQPPPAPLIPNPFQPPPAAPGLPNPFQPPPAAPNPLLPIPPLPGLTPLPPPPAPPAFGFPFPPFPFRPPGVPGTPPRRKP